MSLIVMPGSKLEQTFYAVDLGAYLKFNGPARGHIDPILIAAWCLAGAKKQGCTTIVVECEGIRSITFTILQVEEAIRKKPDYFRGWVLPPPVDRVEALRRRWMEQRFLPSSSA